MARLVRTRLTNGLLWEVPRFGKQNELGFRGQSLEWILSGGERSYNELLLDAFLILNEAKSRNYCTSFTVAYAPRVFLN